MARVIHKCPTCTKQAILKNEANIFADTWIKTYECGHSEMVEGVRASGQDQFGEDTLNITSLDGKRPFKFQIEGGRFLEAANGRALLADEMGIGKTIQSLAWLVAHPEARPFFILCKAGLRVQWSKEGVRWGDFMLQVLDEGSKAYFLPGFDGYIISMDSAWRIGKRAIKDPKNNRKILDYEPIPGKTIDAVAEKLGIKTVVVDECQLMKNHVSKRTNGVRAAARNVPYVIGLSGTPIKNNVLEYFPILNLIRPDKFPSESNYQMKWCDTYFDGYKNKSAGLRQPEAFHQFTKDFILRRERKDVLPDLPKIFRSFNFCELSEMVEEQYKQTIREFQLEYAENPNMPVIGYLSKMRHLTGLAKIEPVCDAVEEFIMSTDRKITIFVHHKDVGETLRLKLEQMRAGYPAEWGKEILELTSEMSTDMGGGRDQAITKFSQPEYRIMIASTLAAGEGLNMQFCSDMIMMERQWNPANEEQAEARFPRPGSVADKINAMYHLVVGTIDEFLSELVEKKRYIVGTTLGSEAVKWDQTSLMKDLANMIMEKGGQKWGF